MKLFSIVFIISLAFSNYCHGSQKVSHYKKKGFKVIELKADLTFECQKLDYIAEVTISNRLTDDVVVNAYKIGLVTPAHGSLFEVSKVGDSSEDIGYRGKWVNMDGVDMSEELVTIRSGHRLSFNYNLSSDYGVSSSDNTSYFVRYSVGAESAGSNDLVYISSKELTVDNTVCLGID